MSFFLATLYSIKCRWHNLKMLLVIIAPGVVLEWKKAKHLYPVVTLAKTNHVRTLYSTRKDGAREGVNLVNIYLVISQHVGCVWFVFLASLFFMSFASSFQTFPCLIKLFVVVNSYGVIAFFKTFLASSFRFEDFAKQPNLDVSSGFCSSLFVLPFLD